MVDPNRGVRLWSSRPGLLPLPLRCQPCAAQKPGSNNCLPRKPFPPKCRRLKNRNRDPFFCGLIFSEKQTRSPINKRKVLLHQLLKPVATRRKCTIPANLSRREHEEGEIFRLRLLDHLVG